MKRAEVEEVPRLERGRFRIAVVGPENAGKSTLVNALLGRAVAEVSEVPGTTKSVSGYRWSRRDVPLYVFDTMGIADERGRRSRRGVTAEDVVERLGSYDLALFVVDVTRPLGPEALRALHVIKHAADLETLLVANKIDLLEEGELRERLRELRRRTGHRPIPVSALRGDGLDRLLSEIERRVRRKRRVLASSPR
ncbi:MAG: Era-like GTP-binding protein [Euryarchaeota archaeon]